MGDDGWTEKEWEAFHNMPCPEVDETVIEGVYTCTVSATGPGPSERITKLPDGSEVRETWERRPDGSYLHHVFRPLTEDEREEITRQR